MIAYYNEPHPFKAEWMRELMKENAIAPGIVDERKIEDVQPSDLEGFTQCHFFAGIGIWSYSLRLAGWPDDRPVWTGSCPCQSFSTAGKQKGTDDARHLWPFWFALIEKRRPPVVFGEQVEAAIRHGWLDIVQADLEREGYAIGSVVLPAAGFGAPHIRSRDWFVAHATVCGKGALNGQPGTSIRQEKSVGGSGFPSRLGETVRPGCENGGEYTERISAEAGKFGLMGDTVDAGRGDVRRSGSDRTGDEGAYADHALAAGRVADSPPPVGVRGVGHAETGTGEDGVRRFGSSGRSATDLLDNPKREGLEGQPRHEHNGGGQPHEARSASAPGPINGFWKDGSWLPCRDGKWRPVESCPVEMVDGAAEGLGLVRLESYPGGAHEESRIIYAPLIQKGKARRGRLHGYGDGIVAPVAAAFIGAYMNHEQDLEKITEKTP